MPSHRSLSFLALAAVVCLPNFGQPIISARSGVVHYSDGSVFVDNQRVEQRPGKFYDVRDGSELRTLEGRAEVLLTPGVVLRIGENSSIRMLSDSLIDTRVQFLRGSAVLDAVDPRPDTSVTIVYGDYRVRFWQAGRYRFDSDPAAVRVYKGEAEVFLEGRSAVVNEGQVLPFSVMLVTQKFDSSRTDSLDTWARNRGDSMIASDAQASGTSDLGTAMDNAQNDPNPYLALGPTYGVPSNYVPFIGSNYYPLGVTPYGYWGGLGFGGPIFVFSVPRYPRYPGISPIYSRWPGVNGFRGLPPTYRPIGAGTQIYRPPTPSPVRVGTPAGGAPVRAIHPLGHR